MIRNYWICLEVIQKSETWTTRATSDATSKVNNGVYNQMSIQMLSLKELLPSFYNKSSLTELFLEALIWHSVQCF